MPVCIPCGGSGFRQCTVCHGTGQGPAIPRLGGFVDAAACAGCGGRRHVQCPVCHGTGESGIVLPPRPTPSQILPPPPAENQLQGCWHIDLGQWIVTSLVGSVLYAVIETSGAGTVRGIAIPYTEQKVKGHHYDYSPSRPVVVGLENPLVGKIGYVLAFDGLHMLTGCAYHNGALANESVVLHRVAYE